MLHYNYSTSLSHFLSYHQLEEQATGENDHSTPSLCEDISQEEDPRCRSNSSASNNKSFTIAAILGLNSKGDKDLGHSQGDHSHHVMNLTNRLQLPVHRTAPSLSTGHYPAMVNHGCSQAARQTVRSLKHLPSSAMQSKKGCKSKRVRTIFTPEQLERLEAEFERQQYMVGPERLYLAHTLQLTEAQVKVWFQNRRIKWRKHHLELTHQRLAVLKQQQMLMEESNVEPNQDAACSEADS